MADDPVQDEVHLEERTGSRYSLVKQDSGAPPDEDRATRWLLTHDASELGWGPQYSISIQFYKTEPREQPPKHVAARKDKGDQSCGINLNPAQARRLRDTLTLWLEGLDPERTKAIGVALATTEEQLDTPDFIPEGTEVRWARNPLASCNTREGPMQGTGIVTLNWWALDEKCITVDADGLTMSLFPGFGDVVLPL